MPIIPGYDSKRNISSERPVPIMNEAAQAFEAPLKAMEVGVDINQKWLAAQDTMDYTKYKSDYATAQARIEAEAENDTDLEGSSIKIKELAKAKDDALKGIRNKVLAQKVAFEADTDLKVASYKIQNTYNKKKLLANELNLDNNINVAAQQRANLLSNPVLLAQADKTTFALIQANVSKGTITPARGKDLWEKYQEGAVDFNIQADTSTTQDSPVLKELLKGDKGVYGNIPPDKLAEKIKDAKINIWRNKVAAKKAEDAANTQGALDMSKALVAKTLTISEIENLTRMGTIDAKTAAIWTDALDKKEAIAEADASASAKYLVNLIELDKSTALDVLNKATKHWADKVIDDAGYEFVIQEANKKLEREKTGKKGWDPSTINFMNSAKGIVDFANAISPIKHLFIASDMVKKLIEKIQGGKEANIAAKEVQREKVLELHPASLTYPKSGKKVMDISGALKTITPEGDLLDAEEEGEDGL